MSCDIHFQLKIAVIEMHLAPLKYSRLADFRRDSAWAMKELIVITFLPPS